MLPQSLRYAGTPQIPHDVVARHILIQPTGQNSITGQAGIAKGFVKDSTMASPAFNQSSIVFDIPTPSKSVYLDCNETVLNFRLVWTVTKEPTVGTTTDMAMRLCHGAASFISQITLLANNQIIEQIQGYDIINAILQQATVSLSQRTGNGSIAMGWDDDSASGINLPFAAVGTYYFSFSIPLLSVIGLNSVEGKLFPVGQLSNLQLQVDTVGTLPVCSYSAVADITDANQGTIAAPVLDRWSLGLKQIDIGSSTQAALEVTWPDGICSMKVSSYSYSQNTLPSGSAGQITTQNCHRAASLKSVFSVFSRSQGPLCPSPNNLEWVNPAVTSFQLSLGGVNWPQSPLEPSYSPARCMAALMASLGASSSVAYGGTLTRMSYNTATKIPTGGDHSLTVIAAGKRPKTATETASVPVMSYPSNHILGIDVERLSGTLFSGQNTRPSGTTLVFQIDPTKATDEAMVVSSFGLFDMLLQFNSKDKTINVLK